MLHVAKYENKTKGQVFKNQARNSDKKLSYSNEILVWQLLLWKTKRNCEEKA